MSAKGNRQKFIRQIGTWSLTMSGISCIIGSGWLFGAYHAAKLAGPASVFSWILGGGATLLIALTVAELGTMFPKSGGMVRYLEYSHGSLAGFISAWSNWFAIVTVIPSEAVASVQYLSSFDWPWAQSLFDPEVGLTSTGLAAASVLLLFYFFLNYWTLNFFVKSMVAVTVFKILVPIITVICFWKAGFHVENFTAVGDSIVPFGWSSVLTAVSACGIVFAFNGFQTPVNLAGEAINPHRSIPMGIIFSILSCLVLYVLLQVTFIGALDPDMVRETGWVNLNFSSPYAQMAIGLNLYFLTVLLYVDAFVSPSGTGISYVATTARMLYGMQRNGYMPDFTGRIHPKYLIPRGAMWLNLGLAFTCLFIFRGWGKLAPVISVAEVLTYLTGPIAVMGLRRVVPGYPRPARIWALGIISPLAFVIASLVFYWSRWPLTGQIIFFVLAGLSIYVYYQHKAGWPDFIKQLHGGAWLLAYMVVMSFLSFIGAKEFNGLGLLPMGWDQVIVAAVSYGFYWWGVKSAWVTPSLNREMSAVFAEKASELNENQSADELAQAVAVAVSESIDGRRQVPAAES